MVLRVVFLEPQGNSHLWKGQPDGWSAYTWGVSDGTVCSSEELWGLNEEHRGLSRPGLHPIGTDKKLQNQRGENVQVWEVRDLWLNRNLK